MRPVALAIQGFRSFRKDTLLRFPKDPGFFMLCGENRVNPELGPNAVGKSSTWDALSWVLYGKTVRGLKGPAAANWEGDHLTSVAFEFERHENIYDVTRTYDPNSLTLSVDGAEPRIVDQAEIDKVVGMNYEAFLVTVMMGQFNEFFFDLPPTAKLDKFSSALDLGRWVVAAKRASDAGSGADRECRRLEQELAGLSGRLSEMRSSRQALMESAEAWRKNQNGLVKVAKQKYEEAEQERATLSKDEKKTAALVTEYGAKLDKAGKKLKVATDAYNELVGRKHKQQADYEALLEDRTKAVAQIKAAKGMTGNCPTCKQTITPKCQVDLVGTGRAHRDFIDAEIGFLESSSGALREELRKSKAAVTSCSDVVGGAERALATEAKSWEGVKAKLAKVTTDVTVAKSNYELAKYVIDPFRDRLEKIGKDVKRLKKSKAITSDALETSRKKLASATRWAKRFKELRLWVVEEALTQFEVEVNNSLVQLGLNGWQVTFDVERETKQGTITKGFTVNIQSPDSGKPVPWEVWCGGETQRLRVAGAIGFAALIRSRTESGWDLEIWDEPTAHMSNEGIDDLMSLFWERARSERRQIWLVDHRTLQHGGLDDCYLVVKDQHGSRIVRKADKKKSA
jgi:Herelleviridae exonuclease